MAQQETEQQQQAGGVTIVTLQVTLDSTGTRHNIASMTKDLVVALEELSIPLGILDIHATATSIKMGEPPYNNELGVLTMEHSELEVEG